MKAFENIHRIEGGETCYLIRDNKKRSYFWRNDTSPAEDIIYARAFFITTPDSWDNTESVPLVVQLNNKIINIGKSNPATLEHYYLCQGVVVLKSETYKFGAFEFSFIKKLLQLRFYS